MKILITGGAGFIGWHLIKVLLDNDYKISVIDNLSTGLKSNLTDEVTFYEMDICSPKIFGIFEKERFDAVVHLAAQTMVNASVENPLFDADINIMGGINVLEACKKNGVKRVVFASSAAVYGDISTLPIQEDFITQPTSFYGLSKLTFEKYLDIYQKSFGLDYIVLRFANVYGEKQGDGGEGGVISSFAKKIAANQGIQIFGDGNQTRDFIYAGDIALAIEKSLKTQRINTVYNISNRKEVSINDIVALFIEISDKDVKPVFKNARQGDIYRSTLDNIKAVDKLSWSANMDLKDGLAKTYNYFLGEK